MLTYAFILDAKSLRIAFLQNSFLASCQRS